MFHISDLKKYNRCKRLFLLDYLGEPSPFQNFVRLDDEVSMLAAKKLGIQEYFLGERNDPHDRAMNALDSYEWLIKARFEYKNLRIKVPFMHKTKKGYDLYFLFLGLYPKAHDIQYYCATVFVLQKLGFQLNDFYLVHLNEGYCRKGELNVDELFVVSDSFYNENKNPTKNVKETIMHSLVDLDGTLNEMEEALSKPIEDPIRKPRCASRQKCIHYNECFEEETFEDNSILTLSASQHRYAMRQNGIKYLKDADLDLVEGSRLQFAQIMADKNGGLFYDKHALKAWMSEIQYPISFIDFEWECYAIPPYDGMHPYDVLPFEYSLHILHEDGHVDHKVFLSVHDDRREFAENLIHDVASQGTVMAYNAFGAEQLRMQELAAYMPDLSKDLYDICDRLKDLQIPFVNGLVYNVKQKGFCSLKQIMSTMDDEGYEDLGIKQGMEAVFQWRHLDQNDDDVNRSKIIQDLKEYCGMDTYAMVVVVKWLNQLIQED